MTKLVPLFDEAKVTSIQKAIGASRRQFPTVAEAIEHVGKAGESTKDVTPLGEKPTAEEIATYTAAMEEAAPFYGLPLGIVGLNRESGELDESIYEGATAIVAYVQTRQELKDGDKKTTGIKAIVVYPAPTLEAFIEDEAGLAFLGKVLDKEQALVAFRNYREFDTLDQFLAGIDKSPVTIADYVTEHARSGSIDTDTFDACWPGMRDYLKKNMKAISDALPNKAEVLKAIRSSAYAAAEYAPLETAPTGSVFVRLAKFLMSAAATNVDAKTKAPAPLPTDSIQGWLDNRDALVLTKAKPGAVDYDAAIAAFDNWAAPKAE